MIFTASPNTTYGRSNLHRYRRVALVAIGLGDLTGGGGAERYFADIFEAIRLKPREEVIVWLVTDKLSLKRFNEIGRLYSRENVLIVPGSTILRPIRLLYICNRQNFDIVHFALPAPIYLPYLAMLKMMPSKLRPRISINVTDCSLAHTYFSHGLGLSRQEFKSYVLNRLFIEFIGVDGVLTSYPLLVEKLKLLKYSHRPILRTLEHFFVDSNRFRPAERKLNQVVFVGRFIAVKQPLFFLEGLHIAIHSEPHLFSDWEFAMYGKGDLEHDVRRRAKQLGLENRVRITHSADTAHVFSTAKIFVSTQDYENVSSMSMLEAMASGNAIIARDVGDTRVFVRPGVNGYLLEEDSVECLANVLIRCVRNSAQHAEFAVRSRQIATTEHGIDWVLEEIHQYWSDLLPAMVPH